MTTGWVAGLIAGLIAGLLTAVVWWVRDSGSVRHRVATVGPREPKGRPTEAGARPTRGADRSGAAGGGATVALVLDLLAANATAGLPPSRSLTVVATAMVPGPDRDALAQAAVAAELGASWAVVTSSLPTCWRPVGEVLGFAVATGAPAAELLHEAAASQRRRRMQQGREGAARLGVMLVLPLGLCSLPAFVLLGVAPMVISLLGDATFLP